MNKFFFPTTLVAVLAIATVFAFVPVDYAQTTHLPTIGSAQISTDSITATNIATGAVATDEILDATITNADLDTDVIPITFTRTAGATTNVDAAFEALGTITLPTFSVASDVIISVNAEVTPGIATAYLIQIPATSGLDCGAGANTAQINTMFTAAGSEGATRVTVNTTFFCTGAASGAAIIVGHDSTTATVSIDAILITALALPT